MSCWRRTTVLRIPAAALGFEYWHQWAAFLKEHERDFQWTPGYFESSLCDIYPTVFPWEAVKHIDRNWRLDQRNPEHPEVVPGPFLDYFLEEKAPLQPEENTYGKINAAKRLSNNKKHKYLPLYQSLFPGFTLEDMENVRWCTYEWYDGAEAPYLYSDLD